MHPNPPCADVEHASGIWKKPATLAALVCGVLISLYRSLRAPNDWSLTVWLTNYEHGFVKRGLPGQLLDPFIRGKSLEEIQTVVTWVSTAFTFTWAAVMIAICGGVIKRSPHPAPAIIACVGVLVSPYAIMAGHTNGYHDAMIFCIAAAATALTLQNRVIPAGALLAIGVLCHENIIVYGGPAVGIAWLLQKEAQPWKTHLQNGGFIAGPPTVAMGALLAGRIWVNPESWVQQSFQRLNELGFAAPDTKGAAISIIHPFQTYLEIVAPNFPRLLLGPPNPTQVGMLLAALLGLIWLGLNTPTQKKRLHIMAACTAAACAPLALHLIAWDTSRFWGFTLGNATLILWTILKKSGKSEPREEQPLLLGGCVLAATVAACAETPLINPFQLRTEWQTILPFVCLLTLAAILENQKRRT